MTALLLLAAPAAAAYAIAYRLADDARRDTLRWAAFHLAWISTIVTLAAAWRT
jgi:hypothetical protein